MQRLQTFKPNTQHPCTNKKTLLSLVPTAPDPKKHTQKRNKLPNRSRRRRKPCKKRAAMHATENKPIVQCT